MTENELNNFRINVFSLKLGNVSNTWIVHMTNISKKYPGKPIEPTTL